MEFSVDSHFVIGKNHLKQNKPCQDHALSKSFDKGFAAVVISDGCSSGGYTEIGSTIITCAALKAIGGVFKSNIDISRSVVPQHVHDAVMVLVEDAQTLLGRNYRDFLATCVYAIVNEDGGFIHMLGDGCAAIKYKNGDVSFIKTGWENNMPFYPIYYNEKKNIFMQDHEKIGGGIKALKVCEYLIDANGEANIEEDKFISINEAVNGYIISITKEQLREIEAICIFSDGLEDFRKLIGSGNADKLDPITDALIRQFSSFKNFEGEFVKRRVGRALSDLSKNQIDPYDDFSMAAIHVKQNN